MTVHVPFSTGSGLVNQLHQPMYILIDSDAYSVISLALSLHVNVIGMQPSPVQPTTDCIFMHTSWCCSGVTFNNINLARSLSFVCRCVLQPGISCTSMGAAARLNSKLGLQNMLSGDAALTSLVLSHSWFSCSLVGASVQHGSAQSAPTKFCACQGILCSRLT